MTGVQTCALPISRNEQASNEGEIIELEYKIRNAEIIEESGDNSVVRFGSVVTVYDNDMGEEATYTVKGTMEADAMNNVISNESPVGVALMGRKKGETVTVVTPNCEYQLKILQIK